MQIGESVIISIADSIKSTLLYPVQRAKVIGSRGNNSKKGASAYQAAKERDADFSALGKQDDGKTEEIAERDIQVDANQNNGANPSVTLLDEEQFEGLAGENEETSQVESETNKLLLELKEAKDKYLRLLAEFDNFKKRTAKERSDLLKYQGDNILVDIVDVLDDLERALKHAEADPESLREGLNLIYKRFVDTLSKWGVRGESAIGAVFDPNIHLAISKVAVDEPQANTVIDEFKKPYFYKDRLLRAGQVVVAAQKDVTESDK